MQMTVYLYDVYFKKVLLNIKTSSIINIIYRQYY